MIDHNRLVAETIIDRLKATRIGVLARGLTGIDPLVIKEIISRESSRSISLCAVGYPVPRDHGIHTQIEDAIGWRNDPEKCGGIVVLAADDVPKIHSLGDLDILTERDVTLYLLTVAEKTLSVNSPRREFWKALRSELTIVPLNMVEQFVDAISSDNDSQDVIDNNLWRLGLLRDPRLTERGANPRELLAQNRNLIVQIGLLSDESRKRLARSLARSTERNRARLRRAFQGIQRFYRTRDVSVLKELDISVVQDLLIASRPSSEEQDDQPIPNNGEGGDSTGGVLKGRRAIQTISEIMVRDGQESEEVLAKVVDAWRTRMADPNASDTVSVETSSGDAYSFHLEMPAMELLSVIRKACSPTSWGGVLHTSRTTIREAFSSGDVDSLHTYEPEVSVPGMKGHGLFSLLRSFDADIQGAQSFEEVLSRLKNSRIRLCENIDLLLSNPLLLLGGSSETRKALDDYVTAYADLLRLCRSVEASLHRDEPDAIVAAVAHILRLDVLYVKTPFDLKAVLLPLHPFHLWRFREVLKLVFDEDRALSRDDEARLASALQELPHLVHFLLVPPAVAGVGAEILPQAGALGWLPTYENHTNRYLGNDGLETITEILRGFLAEVPYARSELRMAAVDVPDLVALMEIVSDCIRPSMYDRAVLDVYLTRGQNAVADLARLELDETDYRITELLQTGSLLVRLHSCPSVSKAVEEMQRMPVHIAVFFDQAQYQIRQGPRAERLLVSPLVITYQYEYSKRLGRGNILPSSDAEEGIFADWHFLVQRAALMPRDQQARLQYDQDVDLTPVNSVLVKGVARWLVIADRLLTPYMPEGGIPLREYRRGLREVGVWGNRESRSISRLAALMSEYNLMPDESILADLVRRFGHIASAGLLSATGRGGKASRRENMEKGFLGTILAAAWYTDRYPDSLIASLDSDFARLWLRERATDDSRADLIGLRSDGGGGLVVEPIEVKTHDADMVVSIERSATGKMALAGQPVKQLKSTLAILAPIFSLVDSESLLLAARREVLKYQLHRECFREVHGDQWQLEWYNRLRDAFATPNPRLRVTCQGLVVHLRLEGNGSDVTYRDQDAGIELSIVGSQTIQRLLTGTPSAPGVTLPSDDRSSSTVSEQGLDETHVEDRPVTNDRADLPQTVSRGRDSTMSSDLPSSSSTTIDQAEEIQEIVRMFLRACESFRVQVRECDPRKAVCGPSVWRLYVRLASGQRLPALRAVLEDIGREMRKAGLLVSTIPGSDEIAVDIPHEHRRRVPLSRGIDKLPQISSVNSMPIPIGVTPEGQDVIGDLSKITHLLVGGTTGAGKTRFLYGILTALILKHPTPDSLRLVLSTSKPEDFSFFRGLPHLVTGRVISDATEAIHVLENAVMETLQDRGRILESAGCVNTGDYNYHHPDSPLCPYVVVVDEFADLADQLGRKRSARDSFYDKIRRIAQLGRNRGIHLILCTQRPSADLVPTNIRNLMNGRVSLRVNDSTASRMILEEGGGELLQMHGDLLYKDGDNLVRAQGYYVEPDDVKAYLRTITGFEDSH